MNGTTAYEGRVEICYDGVWGSVCDQNWDYWDAAIVCLQMGFQGTSQYNTFNDQIKGLDIIEVHVATGSYYSYS